MLLLLLLLLLYPAAKNKANDPGGWSGYAGVVVKSAKLGIHLKLMLGNPGVPNSWCWPNQNKSTDTQHHPAVNNGVIADVSKLPTAERGEGDNAGEEEAVVGVPSCTVLPGVTYHANDLKAVQGAAEDCCGLCAGVSGCFGWTWRADQGECWLKTRLESANKASCSPESACQSGYIGTGPLPPPPPPPSPVSPMPDNSTLTCGYNGKIPGNTTGAILFNLAADPIEKYDLAAAQPANVALLMKYLQPYIDSAVPPLNEMVGERTPDPRAAAAAAKASCWVPWE